MSILLNIIWMVFGGILLGILWHLAGILVALTIIGIPFSMACFRIGRYAFWPFGRELIDRSLLPEGDDGVMMSIGLVGNVLWFIFVGWLLFVGHMFSCILCFFTIIGIPLGMAHFKLALASILPIRKKIVSSEYAEAILQQVKMDIR